MEKRGVIILIIGIIVVLGVVLILITKSNSSKQETNEALLRTAKCFITCPYEGGMILNECTNACSKTYLKEAEDEDLDPRIQQRFGECVKLIQNEEEFDGCLNSLINENKEIIDLTNEVITVNYPTYKAEILSANCSINNTSVTIKITQAEDIDKIGFAIQNEEQEGYPIVMKYSIPGINELKNYEIIHSEENIEFSLKPNKVKLFVGNGENLYLKDEIDC